MDARADLSDFLSVYTTEEEGKSFVNFYYKGLNKSFLMETSIMCKLALMFLFDNDDEDQEEEDEEEEDTTSNELLPGTYEHEEYFLKRHGEFGSMAITNPKGDVFYFTKEEMENLGLFACKINPEGRIYPYRVHIGSLFGSHPQESKYITI